MPTAKKTDETAEAPSAAMCDNHPDVPAAHTTTSVLHRVISLCEECLRRVGEHIRLR